MRVFDFDSTRNHKYSDEIQITQVWNGITENERI